MRIIIMQVEVRNITIQDAIGGCALLILTLTPVSAVSPPTATVAATMLVLLVVLLQLSE